LIIVRIGLIALRERRSKFCRRLVAGDFSCPFVAPRRTAIRFSFVL